MEKTLGFMPVLKKQVFIYFDENLGSLCIQSWANVTYYMFVTDGQPLKYRNKTNIVFLGCGRGEV